VKLNLGHFTARYGEADSNKARRKAFARLLSLVLGATEGAKGQLADRLGVCASRVTAILKGSAALGVHEVPQLDPEARAVVLSALAGVCGYRVVALDTPDADPVEQLEVVQEFLGFVQEHTKAAADGVFDKGEAAALRSQIREGIRPLVDRLDARLERAETSHSPIRAVATEG
jgi:hypothetical protein